MVREHGLVLLAAGLLWACGDAETAQPSSSATSAGGSSSSSSGGSGGASTSGPGGAGAGGGGASNAFVCPPGPFGDPLPLNPDAAPLQGGFHFLEGPVWFGALDTLFFSDMNFGASGADGVPPAIIYQRVGSAPIAPFLDPIGSNGLAIAPDDSLVACTHDDRTISRIDPVSKARSTVASSYMGDKFNSPNDAIVRSDGIIYFTDPTWQLGNRPQETPFKGVYRVRTTGEVELVADDFLSPNGIALSPKEDRLYVADDNSGDVREFAVMPDGSTSEIGVLATVAGADGMGVDCAGNLYVTAQGGVRVLSATGADLGFINVAEKPANVAFGLADRMTLFITARTTLYSIQLSVPGLP